MAKSEGLQIRAARALLRWPIEDLATHSGVDVATIRKAEQIDSELMANPKLADLRRTLEAAGVEFTDGSQPGVRLAVGNRLLGDDQRPNKLSASDDDQER